MTIYKQYTNEQYVDFLNNSFFDNYGISEHDIAVWFVNQTGARPVMNSYGVNYDDLISTYIPLLKSRLAGGYVFFLAITVCEGGGAGNWINHYASDTSTGGVATMNDDIDYILSVLNTPLTPSTSAVEVMGGTPFVEDTAGALQAAYDSLSINTVGYYYMPSTMAGNAWVWGTNWCVANQGGQAPYVYFGNPYDLIINTIFRFGGNPFNGTPSTSNPNDGGPDEGNPVLPPSAGDTAGATGDYIAGKLSCQIFNNGANGFILKKGVSLIKTFPNTYHLNISDDYVNDLIENGGSNGDIPLPPNPPQQPNPPVGPNVPSNPTIYQNILKFLADNQGQAFDTDGVWGAQCVDLIHELSNSFNLNLNTSGLYAKDIYSNPLPPGWSTVNGAPNDDAQAETIWNSLPDGAIVWFTNTGAGHVAVKYGKWATCYQQNYNTDGNGGPIVLANIAPWILSGGAGFLGAWVTS